MISEDDHSLEAASRWVAVLKRGKPNQGERIALSAWLRADLANAAALDLMMRVWDEAGAAGSARSPAPARPARAVVARPRRSSFVWAPVGLAAAACAALVVMLGVQPQTRTYQTAVGQMSQIRLADHSTVWLNTASRLKVTFTPLSRRLSLEAGEAEFQVAHEAIRPFVVSSPDVVVRATGTDFSVRQDVGGARVVLVEGRVKVWRPGAAETGAVALTAGNAITAPHDGAFTVAATDTDAALAWRHGQLIFFDQPLSSVVAEFARYGGVHVRFADPAAGRVRISGAFGARDFKSFVRDMDRLHEIHSYTDEHGETVVR